MEERVEFQEVLMKLKLVKAEKKYQRQITEMLEEWYDSGEKLYHTQFAVWIIIISSIIVNIWR